MHLPQHSAAHAIELDTGAQSSREESSVFISDVNHPQFCMLKGQQEMRVSSDWLSDFTVTLTDSFITTSPGIPHKITATLLATDRIQTLDHIYLPTLLQGATSELTQMDTNQHKPNTLTRMDINQVQWLLLRLISATQHLHTAQQLPQLCQGPSSMTNLQKEQQTWTNPHLFSLFNTAAVMGIQCSALTSANSFSAFHPCIGRKSESDF